MRILQIIDSLRPGGVERQFVELLKGLARDGRTHCEAVVLSDTIHYELPDELSVPFRTIPRSRRFDPVIFSRLWTIIRDFRPDIVHSWNSMCSVYAAPLAKLSGSLFVNSYIHDALPDVDWRYSNFRRGRLTLPFSDIVLANSKAGLDSHRIPGDKGFVIRNGFDQTRLKDLSEPRHMRESLGLADKRIVGMVGSFSDWKDHHSFFQVARQVIAKRPDVAFVTVGGGENLAAFKAEFSPELFPNIVFLGVRHDVESVVNLFSVGVLLSPRGEGISNAIMEYMSLGKPVVASDCPGNRELVQDGITGFLVDVEDVSTRVLQLLDDPALAAAMGERGRARIRDEFNLDRATRETISLYSRLLAAKRGWSG